MRLPFWVRNAVRDGAALAQSLPPLQRRFWRSTMAEHAVVFMFHRILPAAEYGQYFDPERVLTLEAFGALLAYLERHFDLRPLSEFVRELARPRRRPICALTFDDGWEDNCRCAWPLLRAHRAPATIFLTSSYVGRDQLLWPDACHRILTHIPPADWPTLRRHLRLRCPWLPEASGPLRLAELNAALVPFSLDQRRVMAEALVAELMRQYPNAAQSLPRRAFLHAGEIQAMRAAGVEFAAHTVTHADLAGADDQRLREELEGGRRRLAEDLGIATDQLAYPYGSYDDRVVAAAAAAGYRVGATSSPRPARGDDGLRLPRVGLCEAMVSRRPGAFDPAILEVHLRLMLRRARRRSSAAR